LLHRAAGIEPASAGRKRGFAEHCSAPLKRLALASARLSDSTDQREIGWRFPALRLHSGSKIAAGDSLL
jgi:hypothetical protein